MEQADGISQVNRALMQMDEMTQQNASLVEEAAAASEAMGAQAEELTSLVSYFKLADNIAVSEAVKVGQLQERAQAESSVNHRTAVATQPKVGLPPGKTTDDSDWEEF